MTDHANRARVESWLKVFSHLTMAVAPSEIPGVWIAALKEVDIVGHGDSPTRARTSLRLCLLATALYGVRPPKACPDDVWADITGRAGASVHAHSLDFIGL